MLIDSTRSCSIALIRHRWTVSLVGLVFVASIGTAWGQTEDHAPPDSGVPSTTPIDPHTGATSEPAPAAGPASTSPAPAVMDPTSYGLWVLAPALVAIGLAIVMRQAVPALFIGIVFGAYMLVPCRDPAAQLGHISALHGIRLAMEHYVIQAIARTDHIMVILFTLLIGGAVGVMTVSGGTRALVDSVARFASSSRRGQLTAWLAGMVVFFDDYANSMIVGPTMRPMCDRLKISRAKLAYIVDSTAAPVASIALIGTWLGAELGYIQEGLDAVAANGAPAFLTGVNNMDVFVSTIPFRFYPIFALWMVVCIALTGRDFGPMRRSESHALIEEHPDVDDVPTPDGRNAGRTRNPSAWLAAGPILVLVGLTVTILFMTGRSALAPGDDVTLQNILRHADPFLSILYGALGSIASAAALALIAGAASSRVAFDGALDGMAKMFPAVAILVLAWALSQVSQDLNLGAVLKDHLVNTDIAPDWLPMPVWLPLSVFICAAGVSFATGTSWTTMGILTPAVVEITAHLAVGLPGDQPQQLFYAAVGAVLAGSIFGDHCSPISDTTVLSAVASSCRVEEHVWTQMPYAVVTALVAMAAGNVFCMYQHKPAWTGLLVGAAALLLIVLVIGRKPQAPPPPPQPIPSGRIDQRLATPGSEPTSPS